MLPKGTRARHKNVEGNGKGNNEGGVGQEVAEHSSHHLKRKIPLNVLEDSQPWLSCRC